MRTTIPTLVLVLVAAALALAACGSDEEQDEAREATTALTDTGGLEETLEDAADDADDALEEALTRDLEEQNASGISGTVELEPQSQDEIRVTIELEGSPAGASHPAHIHEGTCANLDPQPKYPLENVENGRSETTIEASPLELFTGEFAVNVHDAEDPSVYVACADIPAADD